jgi:hypothetical protein
MANDKWMSEQKDVIGNMQLKDVVLPGTHDTATFNCTNILAKPWTRCQSANILEQLESGIRFMDIRLRYKRKENDFYAHHSIIDCDTTVEEIMNDINSFFSSSDHSYEILILRISHLDIENAGQEEDLIKRIVNINDKVNPLFEWRPLPGSVTGATNQTINNILNQGCNIIAIFDNIYLSDDYIEVNYPIWCNDNDDNTKRVCTMDQVWADTDSVTDLEYQLSQYQAEQANEQSLFVLQGVLTPKSSLSESNGDKDKPEGSIIPPSVYNLSKENNSTILAWISLTGINGRLNIIFMNFTTESFSTWNNKDLIDTVIDINIQKSKA